VRAFVGYNGAEVKCCCGVHHQYEGEAEELCLVICEYVTPNWVCRVCF
jgi:hypothetical protein